MNIIAKFDSGWLYLLCGLILTVSAIILPAHQDLKELAMKRVVIQNNVDELEYQIQVYKEFLQELQHENPELRQRIIEMQFNIQVSGTPVVVDSSASQTPLEWLSQRIRRDTEVPLISEQSSILSNLSSGRSRLFLVGLGVFAIFVGLVKSPKAINDQEF